MSETAVQSTVSRSSRVRPERAADLFRKVVEGHPAPVFVLNGEGRITYANTAAFTLYGTRFDRPSEEDFTYLFGKGDSDKVRAVLYRLSPESPTASDQLRTRTSHGGQQWHHWEFAAVFSEDETLEAVEAVAWEISASDAKEAEYARRLADLEVKSRQMEEVNEALRALLSQSRDEFQKFEQKLAANVQDLVLPYLSRLKHTALDTDQKVYVNVIENNIAALMTPFMQKIRSKRANLTPREIEVANLVRQGQTSEEIADILNVSKRAVEFHRASLRRKLGLKKTKRNLRSFLATL